MRNLKRVALGTALGLLPIGAIYAILNPELLAKRKFRGEVACPVAQLSYGSNKEPATVAVLGEATCDGERVSFVAGWVDIPIQNDGKEVAEVALRHLGKNVMCRKFERTAQEKVMLTLATNLYASNFLYRDCTS